MKPIVISAVILLLTSTMAFTQNRIFRKYRFECSQSFGIELKKLKGFKVINEVTFLQVNDRNNIAGMYYMALESKAKDCLILYPYFGIESSIKIMTYGEVEAALGFPERRIGGKMNIVNDLIVMQGTAASSLENGTEKLDSAKYVKMITGNNMNEYFNADTVYIYTIPLPENYRLINFPITHKAKYNSCIGINVIKTGYPSAMMKILFTEEGRQKEDEYLQLLLRSICYKNNGWKTKLNSIQRSKKMLEEHDFP